MKKEIQEKLLEVATNNYTNKPKIVLEEAHVFYMSVLIGLVIAMKKIDPNYDVDAWINVMLDDMKTMVKKGIEEVDN